MLFINLFLQPFKVFIYIDHITTVDFFVVLTRILPFVLFITDSWPWPLCPWNPDEGQCFRH